MAGRKGGVAVAGAALVLALVASTGAGASVRPAAPPLDAAQLAAGADHQCVVGTRAPAPVAAWSSLANPILSYPDAGAKDEALVYAAGRWHMIFSEVTGTPATAHFAIATATSADLTHWGPATPWPHQAGTEGVASPDVVRDPSGGFVVTYQSDADGAAGGTDQLFYRTSPDLEHFSAAHPLARGLAARMIDGALAFPGHGAIVGFKAGGRGGQQHFEIAWSPSGSLSGPWHLVGRPSIEVVGGTIENGEFVWAQGAWRLVATSNNLDEPWIFTLAGDPADPRGWLYWRAGRELAVAQQGWDTGPGISSVGYEAANSAYLCVDGATDYLLYAGSHELTAFGGWGHAAIGIARSSDLVHWQLPESDAPAS
jgi:hypothetical protein